MRWQRARVRQRGRASSRGASIGSCVSAFVRACFGSTGWEDVMTTDLDLDSKIALLMSLAAADQEGPRGGTPTMPLPPRLRHATEVGALRPFNLRTVQSSGPRGRQTTLLRILMTNECSFNCHYCPMRRDRDMPRPLLKPAELVRVFLASRERGWC